MNKTGFVKSEKNQRIDNIPDTGTLTGNYKIDHYGCWWEYLQDTGEIAWIIGDYPNE